MAQLTNKALRSVRDALDKSFFGIASFTIKTSEDGGDTLLYVSFIDTSDYYFSIKRDAFDGFFVSYTPGEVLKSVCYKTEDFNNVVRSLVEWSECIRDELIHQNPLHDELERFKAEINEKLNNHFQDATSRFSTEEIEGIEQRLADLLSKFEELQQQNAITEQELRKLSKTVDELKNEIMILPKKTWYRVAANKLTEFACKALNSTAGQKAISDITSKLLNPPPPAP